MERVLVVDDDDAIRKVAAEILEDAGYQVYTARSGRAAFAVLRSTHHRLIVVLGGTMPTMTGWEALEALMRDSALARRHVYIIFSADWRLLAWAREQHAIPQRAVLRKPFTADQLLGVVRWGAGLLERSA
ncbi:MAG TPA: response regulator [Ktedonobacterales bacterium]